MSDRDTVKDRELDSKYMHLENQVTDEIRDLVYEIVALELEIERECNR